MHLSKEVARKILDLNPYKGQGLIDDNVSERQFKVIVTAFNYLSEENNDFLYVADEVGLGKTYIAIGIASLLKLYSTSNNNFVTAIVVPKKNLQYKWIKDLKNFIKHNYMRCDNIVKNVIVEPVGRIDESIIVDSLRYFSQDTDYIIYRNSSFSIGSDMDEDSNWKYRLKEKLKNEDHKLFEDICCKYKREPIKIKRAYAYLLNKYIPVIDLLIVDEAHNFKHGNNDNGSIRNQIISRFLGVNTEDEIFTDFPCLKEFYCPKVKKLLLLSATPINRSLVEIKNQLDCFLPSHSLSNDEDVEKFIGDRLNQFMIRGVMNTEVNNRSFSRNQYRHEHRKGNVCMKKDAEAQFIKDDASSLVYNLIQYKTIKELKQKNNNQFEMGMLAGFESFESSSCEYERASLENRNEKEAKDEHIINNLITSYRNEFENYPPHPKQENLVNELFDLMLKREKSLVFVRRIASVTELERKVLKKYSDYLIEIIKKIAKERSASILENLIDCYRNVTKKEEIKAIITTLGARIFNDVKDSYTEDYFDETNTIDKVIINDLLSIYSLINIEDDLMFSIPSEVLDEYKRLVIEHLGKKNIKQELKDISIKLINEYKDALSALNEKNEGDVDDLSEVNSPYFFQSFFNNEGKLFKNNAYKKDWYEINLLLINERYQLFDIEYEKLNTAPFFSKKANMIEKFDELRKKIGDSIRGSKTDIIVEINSVNEEYRKNTLITEILLNLCEKEFNVWIETYKGKYINHSDFIRELETLVEIIKSVFRQGSGLLPVFVGKALSNKDSFIEEMCSLLRNEFIFVLKEIKDIITDYNIIVERNFDDKDKIRFNLIQQLPVTGVSGQHKRDVRKTAIQFRMPGYPYVLITTDILKEGEDLHLYCKNIYHYGIAWNPSDMEQRTGRIDRIGSLTSKLLKNITEQNPSCIPFENKLQVFYPYLTDTIEVNQMIKLFHGMNKFTDIFYNDLTLKIEQDSKVSLDDVVDDIPVQKEGNLKSKYDVDNFLFKSVGAPYELKDTIGSTYSTLDSHLNEVFIKLNNHKCFNPANYNKQTLRISGVLDINNRRGPYDIYIKQGAVMGAFSFFMESKLGRVQTMYKHNNRSNVIDGLNIICKQKSYEFLYKENNSYAYITYEMSVEEASEIIYSSLLELIQVTDDIENEMLGSDENFSLN